MQNVLLWSLKLPKQIENMINKQVAASPLWFSSPDTLFSKCESLLLKNIYKNTHKDIDE
jgi:frataxin-like iron-binding protein CyaY